MITKRARCCHNAASEVNRVVREPFKREIKLVLSDVRCPTEIGHLAWPTKKWRIIVRHPGVLELVINICVQLRASGPVKVIK